MTDEIITQIAQPFLALAVTLWMLREGMNQHRELQEIHRARTDKLIEHLLADNARKDDLLISCISAVSKSPCDEKTT